MEIILYFLIGGSAFIFLILQLDKQQRRRVNKILKDTKTVHPLFLLRATELKLRTLNTILYGNMPTGLNSVPSGRVNMDEGARQMIASQLSNLVSEYNMGKIPLKVYNNQLRQLLKMVDEIKGMRLERI